MKRPLIVTLGILLLVLVVAILAYLFEADREQSPGESERSVRNDEAPSPAVPRGNKESIKGRTDCLRAPQRPGPRRAFATWGNDGLVIACQVRHFSNPNAERNP
jgi:hypothetical protein